MSKSEVTDAEYDALREAVGTERDMDATFSRVVDAVGRILADRLPAVREAGDEGIAAVLAAHVGTATMFCRACPEWRPDDLNEDERVSIRRHQVEMLAPLIAEREAKAWDECKHAYFQTDQHPVVNPYRAALAPEVAE